MSTEYKTTVAMQAMQLGQRKNGVISKDIPAKYQSDISKVFRRLIADGYLRCVQSEVMPYIYKCTESQFDAWLSTKKVLVPAKPKPVPPPRSAIQPQVSIKRTPARKGWAASDPMHLPHDENGKPLYKVTKCPGFTAAPTKSNTFTGAY